MVGDHVAYEITNTTSEAIGTNLCFVNIFLYRHVRGRWAVEHSFLAPDGSACFDNLPFVEPGGQSQGQIQILSDIPPGRYRLHTSGRSGGRRVILTSGSFRVIRK